jgi:hypothetical protein
MTLSRASRLSGFIAGVEPGSIMMHFTAVKLVAVQASVTRRNVAVFVDELDASRFPDYSAAWGS